MTPQQATSTLAALRDHRASARRQRYRPSKLARHRAELVALRQAGASYRELAYWLRRERRVRTDPTTIRRYLIQLPELADAEDPADAEFSKGAPAS